eukprot:CAMPEP_0205935726 /NCGR_PEP_ID=MMETSP1325-20131115/39721_1 /ASSEMBLY_ACC=CAM_ASM_000708 /TAXON_ID=236786 /ORGANISM="Florenciella sp., Strain RCC1007" /LENGTH=47 /DNA_ID= /DNA_START= /DNA_END= /DNA_ORIENTATION=
MTMGSAVGAGAGAGAGAGVASVSAYGLNDWAFSTDGSWFAGGVHAPT